ncbi:hypothetical protein [Oryzibacter oryziterrae]|uniref:hypothetical protein n=1 Tax=Oryzibacter oryziterrae TaxID=2766474 RepID=UPI001F400DC6|nr:hypothetical protein [Oryzibacter oryziterrae]
MSDVAASFSPEIVASEPATKEISAGLMIFLMLALFAAVVAAGFVFGYAAVIIYALGATFTALTTIVILTAGW